ncbi:MAG: HTTM domain-containing protein [Planctomycetes bacterium]|nr:HTTM domain-containing protein [Planctomycetota bacterium]
MEPSCGLGGDERTSSPACGIGVPAESPQKRPPSRLGERVTGLAATICGVDLRSLALFRIGLAVLLLCDLWFRVGSLSVFYTDQGVLPRIDQPIADPNAAWHVSLHLANGSAVWQAALFAIAAGFAFMLLAGWRTRLATICSWVLLLSLHARNPQVLQGGDVLLRCLLFWAMFLPLGAVFSVDRARAALRDEPPPTTWRFASVASAALLLQVAFVYWFSSALKTDADWLTDRTAVFYALSIEQLSTPLGQWLLNFPEFLRALTAGTMVQEAYGPYVAFVPGLLAGFWSLRLAGQVTEWSRLLVVVAFVGFHLGLAATMELGPFPYICWVAWIPFLPALFWDGLARRRRKRDPVQIWYDGDCGFCKAMARLLETFLLIPAIASRPCQDDPTIHADMIAQDSWVVVGADGVRRYRFDGLVFVLAHSPWLGWLAHVLALGPITSLGTRAYRWIARHRSQAARLLFFMRGSPSRNPKHGHMLADATCAFLLCYVLLWNIRSLHANSDFNLWSERWFPVQENWILVVPGLDQYWSMFSPRPLRDDGWYVAEATLQDGSKVDLLSGLSPSDAKPRRLSAQYPNERWRKYLMNLSGADFAPRFRQHYARWLCDRWNAAHEGGEHAGSLDLYFWKKTNRFGQEPLLQKELLAHYPLQ